MLRRGIASLLLAWIAFLPAAARAATGADVSFGNAGGTKTVPVQAVNQGGFSYSGRPSSSAGWVSATMGIQTTDGVKFLVFTVTAQANPSGSNRKATITMTVSGTLYVISVSQGSAPTGKPDLAFYTPEGWPAPVFLTAGEDRWESATVFDTSQIVHLNYSFANDGNATAPSSKLLVVLRDSSGTTVDSWWVSTSPLNPASYRVRTSDNEFDVALAPGSYTATVTLDSDGVLDEWDESNNSRSVSFTVVDPSLPDLRFARPASWPDSVFLSSSSTGKTAQTAFQPGTTVHVNYAWEILTADVSASYAVLLQLYAPSGNLVWSHTATLSTANGKDKIYSAQPSLNLPGSMEGVYTLKIRLDSGETVAEADEANNSASLAFSVTSTPLPDVRFAAPPSWPAAVFLSSSPSGKSTQTAFRPGTAVYVNYAWEILGFDVSSPYSVLLQLFGPSGNLVWSDTTSVASSGENGRIYSSQPSLNLPESLDGTCTLKITLDSGGTVAEADETNNSATLAFSVAPSPSPVFRFYSKSYKGHFYTIDPAEMQSLRDKNPNWAYEGVAYCAHARQTSGTVPLYRFYSKSYRGHFFTTDEREMWTVRNTNPNWTYEGVAYYVRPSEATGTTPVYRFWSKGYRHHFYTVDYREMVDLRNSNPNWAFEGTAFHAWPNDTAAQANSPPAAEVAPPLSPPASASGTGNGTGTRARKSWPEAEWTLTAASPAGLRNDATARDSAVALPGDTLIGSIRVETTLDIPETEELAASASAFLYGNAFAAPTGDDAIALRLSLPGGLWSASLWNAVDGTVLLEEAETAFEFTLSATGVWHWLCLRGPDGAVARSIWLRAE